MGIYWYLVQPGALQKYGALDFAPPSEESGCKESPEWVVASAAG